DEVLTSLGIGEALISALSEKGIPTPLAHTMIRAPMSRMDVLKDDELKDLLRKSSLIKKYNEVTDRESAYEILTKKIADANTQEAIEKSRKETEAYRKAPAPRASTRSRSTTNPWIKTLSSPTVIRSLLGVLGKM